MSPTTISNDPLAAFASDEDDEVEEDDSTQECSKREKHNGALAFHPGTEQSLLLYVRQQCNDHKTIPPDDDDDPLAGDTPASCYKSRQILRAVDQFCLERHWMMHIGPQKGAILSEFLTERFRVYLTTPMEKDTATTTSLPPPPPPTFAVVELGTYCGYSTTLMVQTMLQQQTSNDKSSSFHIFTVDVDAKTQQVAKQLVQEAGFSQYVTFVLLPSQDLSGPSSPLVNHLTAAMQTMGMNPSIDFLFIDHAKELYLSDLQLLERAKFMPKGSAVAADNVIFFQLNAYRQYMIDKQREGVAETKLVSEGVLLEYVSGDKAANEQDNLKDGLELTVYTK